MYNPDWKRATLMASVIQFYLLSFHFCKEQIKHTLMIFYPLCIWFCFCIKEYTGHRAIQED